MGPDADAGQVVGAIDLLGPRHGSLDHVMHGPQRERGVEEVAQEGDHTAVGAVTGQDQGEDQLTEPRLGDRQVEEDLLVRSRRIEGVLQGELCRVGLLVEELAADLMLAGQLGDRLCAGEDLHGQLLPLLGRELLCGAGYRDGDRDQIGLRGGDEQRTLTQHVCFLRVMALVWYPLPAWRKQAVEKSSHRSHECYLALNQVQDW